MHIKRAHTFVVRAIVKLGLVIAQLSLSRMVSYVENLLSLVTQQPKISHVHRPRTLTLDRRIHNSNSSLIINVNGGGGLWMDQFMHGRS